MLAVPGSFCVEFACPASGALVSSVAVEKLTGSPQTAVPTAPSVQDGLNTEDRFWFNLCE